MIKAEAERFRVVGLVSEHPWTCSTAERADDEAMPRYHYSRATSNSPLIHDLNDERSDQLPSVTTNEQPTGGTFQSTFVPFLPTNRLMKGQKREYIQIPISREDNGVSSSTTTTRTVPITFTSETSKSNNGTHFVSE